MVRSDELAFLNINAAICQLIRSSILIYQLILAEVLDPMMKPLYLAP